MDAGEIIRNAHERGEQVQTYDPGVLVREVEQLLRDRGLRLNLTGRVGMAHGAAGMMLRAFGVVPSTGYTGLDRIHASYPDNDEPR